jgi:hypothetical protein
LTLWAPIAGLVALEHLIQRREACWLTYGLSPVEPGIVVLDSVVGGASLADNENKSLRLVVVILGGARSPVKHAQHKQSYF